MTENKDYYEAAKKEMRLSERILAELPGFRGYKEKELRRESDRLIRDHIYRKITQARNDVKDVYAKLSDRRQFDVLTDMDRLVAHFDRVSERVNHASYGYSGFFDTVKIKEDDLDRMIDFDNQLVDSAAKMVDEATAFKTDLTEQKFDTAKQHIQTLFEALEAFEQAFDKRRETIIMES